MCQKESRHNLCLILSDKLVLILIVSSYREMILSKINDFTNRVKLIIFRSIPLKYESAVSHFFELEITFKTMQHESESKNAGIFNIDLI